MNSYNTFKDITLKNEKTVKLTLNFSGLNNLRTLFPDIYNRYSKISIEGADTELDFVLIIYTAYVCANYNDEHVLTEQEFFELCPENRGVIYTLVTELMYPSKN